MQIQIGSSTLNGKPLSPKTATTILIAVFILVNVLLLSVLGVFAALNWKSIYLYFNGEAANGIVVDFKSTGGVDPASAAVIEFKANRQSYVVDTSYYSTQSNELGDHLEVIYYPDDPSIAIVNTYEERWETLVNISSVICPSLLVADLTILFVLAIRMAAGRKINRVY